MGERISDEITRIATSAVRRATAIPTVKMMLPPAVYSVSSMCGKIQRLLYEICCEESALPPEEQRRRRADVKMAIRSLISLVDV